MPFIIDISTDAQKLQVNMIKEVFKLMDADNDGCLTFGDIKSYFQARNRPCTDSDVKDWILRRDIDQDGAVNFQEFLASFSSQLDPGYLKSESIAVSNIDTNTVATAFGLVRIGNTVPEVIEACDAIEGYVRRIINSPTVQVFWSIPVSDAIFHQKIGKLFGGIKLMQAMGFNPESNGAMLAVRNENSLPWDALPVEIRVDLNRKVEQLISHKAVLLEPTISNIAAGNSETFACLYNSLLIY